MKIAIDTWYSENDAYTVGVIFSSWKSKTPKEIVSCHTPNPFPYIPGQFYKRELPCILDLLKKVDMKKIDTIIIDGYIWLRDDFGIITEGLGAHLWEELGGEKSGLCIIGVAKSRFGKCEEISSPVLRGTGTTPLFVQAVGKIGNREAGKLIKSMPGKFKLPEILKTLDKETKTLIL